MKTIFALAVLGLVAVSVSAHGGGGGSRERGFGGGWWKRCECTTSTCAANVNKNVACYNARNLYLQCVGTTCSNQTCPDNSLFNKTSLVCEPCKTGFHVNAQKTKCVCNQGTDIDRTTGTCSKSCPTDAAIGPDSCRCNGTKVLDIVNNACKDCPAGSTLSRERHCQCTNANQLWSTADFACKDCPGTLVNTGSQRRPKTECTCPTAGNILNRYSVTCVACPANSQFTSSRKGSYCRCNTAGEVFDEKTNTCVAYSTLLGADSSGSSSEGY